MHRFFSGDADTLRKRIGRVLLRGTIVFAELAAGDAQRCGAPQVDADVLIGRHRFARSLGEPNLPSWR